jgi:hypothetical protein
MQPRQRKPSDPLSDTVADGGRAVPLRRSALEELARLRPEPGDLQIGRDILDETVADLEAVTPSDDEVQLDKILDRPQAVMDASLYRYDPEAGRTNVAVKIKVVSEAVKNTLKTPFGKMLFTIPVFLAGVALTIAAVTYRTWAWIGPAALVMPVGFALAYWRYQAWLGSKRYMYRLLESLGEDVTDFDPHKANRRLKPKKPR